MRKTTLLLFLVIMLHSVTALAGPGELMKYAPKSSKLVMGANIAALKPSPLYAEMMALLRGRPAFGAFLSFLETEASLNVDRDVESVVVAMPDVSITPAQANAQDTMTIIVRGKFDQKKLTDAMNTKYPGHSVTKEGTQTRHTIEAFTIAFVSDQDLVMTTGDVDFQTKSWVAVANAKESAVSNKDIAKMAAKVNLTRGMWLVGVTSQLVQNGPKMNVAGLTVDLVSGLKVDIIGTMHSKEDVKTSLQDFENIRKEATNPMVTMMGASPLITNMKTGSSGLDITVTTKMTAPEMQRMVGLLKASIASGTQAIAPSVQGKGQEAAPVAPAKGADADFN